MYLAPLAQLAEHRTLNPQVPGSSPGGRTTEVQPQFDGCTAPNEPTVLVPIPDAVAVVLQAVKFTIEDLLLGLKHGSKRHLAQGGSFW